MSAAEQVNPLSSKAFVPRAILTYHSIDDSGSVVSIAEAILDRQMRSLADRAIAVTTPPDLLAADRDALSLTFDDGFANFYSRAYPILAELGLSATVLLPAGLCGEVADWRGQEASFRERDLLTWSKVRELLDGGIQFGAHGMTHRALPSLPFNEARAEILDSKRLIEDKTGVEVRCFAYPYGMVSASIAALVAETFQVGLSTDMGFLSERSRPEALERIDAYYLRHRFWFDRLFETSGRSFVACRAAARNWRRLLSPDSVPRTKSR